MYPLLLALSLFYPQYPVCSGGTAWVNPASDPPAMILQAKCDGCTAECKNVGTRSEGWYSSCDGSLIEWTICGVREPVACTMDAKLCPDGVTYVGREGPNCEFAACPGEELPNTKCDPYVCSDGTRIDRCSPDGSIINYFAPPCMTHGGEEGAPFEDVTSDHENADAIYYVKQQGIVQGYEDGTYKPDQTINRAEFAKIVLRTTILRNESVSECIPGIFSDVRDEWFLQFVCGAAHLYIVSGYPDGTFRPANSVNFVEAAKMIVKAFGLEASTTIPACEGQCPWYEGYVRILEARGTIPTSVASFDQPLTRGEMAEMIYRLKTGNNGKPSKTYEELAHPSNIFDFETLRPGMRVGEMTVESTSDFGAVFTGSVTVTGEYVDDSLSAGEMGIKGTAMWHFDPESAAKLPSPNEDGYVSFTFRSSPELYKHVQRGSKGVMTATVTRLTMSVLEGGNEAWFNAITDVRPGATITAIESCAATYERTRECPEDRCYMDCAQRDYPNGGLGCPPGCFEKP